MNKPSSPFDLAATELRAVGMTLSTHPGTYCVNFRGANAATAYFSDDLADAVEHGRAMAASVLARFIERGQVAQQAADRVIAEAAENPPKVRRVRRPKKMTAKARRRRMIRAHNQRMRSRAVRQRREEG